MEDQMNENCGGNNNAISISVAPSIHTNREDDDTSVTSRELCTQRLDLPEPENDNTTISRIKYIRTAVPSALVKQLQTPITNQPLRISTNVPAQLSSSRQPQSLFFQALTNLNESSIRIVMADKSINPQFRFSTKNYSDVTPPDSLTNAPPSYSFVLRQMAVRRRPRLMGTFISSPSYIQHSPPPNYAAAFDVYVDSPLPPPPTRVYNFGFTPIPIVCPECGYTGVTMVSSKTTLCTHLCAVILCLLCCWLCAPLPYLLRSCKNVYHYCRNCRNYLGMYCPTYADSSYA